MKSSHLRKRSSKKSQSSDRLNIDSIQTFERSPQKSMIYEKLSSQVRQNNAYRNDRVLIELPKIYPLHKKLLSMKSKEFEIMKLNDKRFQLRGFKFIHQNQPLEESTLDAQQFEKNSPSLKKKQSNISLNHIFDQLILKINGIHCFLPLKNVKILAYVQEGNNSRLIKELLRKRNGIKLVPDKTQANLVWTRFSDYQSFDKGSRFTQTFEKNKAPLKTDQQYIQAYQKISNLDMNDNFLASRKCIQLTTFFMHNHLKNHEQLSDKKNLFRNIHSYCTKYKIDQNKIIPKTYHFDLNKQAKQQIQVMLQKICQQQKKQDFFVLKPGQDTNRGTGISVVKGSNQIIGSIVQLHKIGKSSLLQQYIQPLLYKNRKFDLRCYVLVTSVGGQLKAYWYKQGYLRTCCKQFSYDQNNIYGHLTNDAVQKKHKDYGKYEQANKLSFNDLQAILMQTERNRADVVADMKNLAVHSIKSAQEKLKAPKNVFAFEIFGYDFLIDKQGKVWLIQINTNPCLEFSGSLLSRIIWHMVDNSIKIAVDPFIQNDPKRDYHNYLQLNKYECII